MTLDCRSHSFFISLDKLDIRMATKSNSNVDEPGAFPSREVLRTLTVGKQVTFETRYASYNHY